MKAARFELVFLIISVLAGIAAVISPTNHIGIARAKTNKAYPYPYPSPTIIVTNTNNSGTGSLRQAILTHPMEIRLSLLHLLLGKQSDFNPL